MSFTFNGIPAESMGVHVLPYSRTFVPEQRAIRTIIQGRSGTYDFTDGSFGNGTITVPCQYWGSTAPSTIRQVAAWLNGTGQLIFDDEPDLYYQAQLWPGCELSRMFYEDSFDLSFVVFPFAFSAAQTLEFSLTASGGAAVFSVDGTAQTPCRLIITNTGTQTINNLMISHYTTD